METRSHDAAAEPCVLVIGYGNPGRHDDGLGPAAAEALAALALPGVRVTAAYHLAPEDAADAVAHERVIFIDAARRGPAPFAWHDVVALDDPRCVATHGIAPAALLGLCERVYGRVPRARLLAIRGYAFGVREGLSPRARANLAAAVAALAAGLRRAGPAAAQARRKP